MASHAGPVVVSLIVDPQLGPGARHGLSKTREALARKGVSFEETHLLDEARGQALVIVGPPGSRLIRTAAPNASRKLPATPEALLVQHLSWLDRPGIVVCGADDRGLMYALLDLADRIGWAPDPASPLSEVRDAAEAPAVVERALSIYTMHKATFEQRFFDEAYWNRYLDTLARNRFNTFALLFAYECAGYFAPPYPYFLDVDGFPEVHVVGYTPEMQQRSLEALNRLIAMTHAHGLDFTLGIWDHIYRGGVQTGGVVADPHANLRWRVSGLTQDTLMPYTVAALATLLERVPNLDAIQFRMHNESGLSEQEMGAFWSQVYDVILAHAPHLRFDARAKEFPDDLIDLARQKGIKIRICTKYWMEQMGLPSHPTHVHPQNQHDRRHGYADLLRYPKRYPVHWRLWNGGTSRILLWGDPDYVRRFVESTHLYDGEGFEVNEPLATKMAAQDHDLAPFELLNPAYRDYTWEFERYWHFFQLFGRLGYNPATPAEVWEHEFTRRYGAAAEAIARGLHLASRVLPRIVTYNYPYHLFPTTRGWIEKQRMGNLPVYAAALPSDTQQFLSISQEARNQLDGGVTAKVRPQRTAAWFDRAADAVLAQAALAERQIGDHRSGEFTSTLTDLRILAYLARYHARRAYAGVQWALFDQSQDVNALDAAIALEGEGLQAWEQLVAAAGDVYTDNLMMGLESAGMSGHWRDELVALRAGLAELEAQREAFRPPAGEEKPWIAHVPVRKAAPGAPIWLWATVSAPIALERVGIRYWSDTAHPSRAAMQPVSGLAPEGLRWRGSIPGSAVRPGLAYVIEAADKSGAHRTSPARGVDGPIRVTVTTDDTPPTIVHEPVTTARAHCPLTLRATVQDASGVRWVRLRYRSVTQFEDYRTLEMTPTGHPDVYEVTIPGHELDPTWDFMYLIEAMDEGDNGVIYPDLETTVPYIVVRLIR